MDLRRVRTFITVAKLGTVSKAALRLRIAQPALSRQLADLEQELGLKLFDRVGRRLRMTGEGEQLLGDCRGLLTYAAKLGERAQQLRSGDVGVLKVGATLLHIEGVLSQFLHRFAEHYPNVQVQMTEGSGREILAMLERGEIDLGQMLPHAVQLREGRSGSQQLVRVELLAAFHPSMALCNHSAIEVGRARGLSIASARRGIWAPPGLRGSLPPRRGQAENSVRKPRPIPCSLSLKQGTAWPSLGRLSERTVMICKSFG